MTNIDDEYQYLVAASTAKRQRNTAWRPDAAHNQGLDGGVGKRGPDDRDTKTPT